MRTVILIALFSVGHALRCQPCEHGPRIGGKLPDFTLNNVHYFKHRTVTNESFKGKWLMLHFWSLGCASAVSSLDKMHAIQSRFSDKLQVQLVGYNGGSENELIEVVFKRKKKTNKYQLPVAYDSLLYEQWSLKGVPVTYIVDPDGVLRFITPASDLTIAKVADLLDNKKVSIRPLCFQYADDENYDNLVYASVLSRWRGQYPDLGYELDRFEGLPDRVKAKGWRVVFASLTRLYQYAYYGRGWFFPSDTAYYGSVFELPIIEVSDKAPFTSKDFNSGAGYYNYYLKLPIDSLTQERIMRELQKALDMTFKYSAFLEARSMPVWWLQVCSEKVAKKLRTKGGEPEFIGGRSIGGVTVRNYSVRDFLRLVTANLPNDERIPFLDGTGISFRIDADIQTDMTDFRSVQSALRRCGLELVKGEKEMTVLVIRNRDDLP